MANKTTASSSLLVHCFDVFSALRPAVELKCPHLPVLTSNSRHSKFQQQHATESHAVIGMSKQEAQGAEGGIEGVSIQVNGSTGIILLHSISPPFKEGPCPITHMFNPLRSVLVSSGQLVWSVSQRLE